MQLKMHAAVVERFGKPLDLVDIGRSLSGTGQILVKTEACGRMPHRSPCGPRRLAGEAHTPFIPGHEAIGLVVAIGSGRNDSKRGRPGGRAVALFGMWSLRVLPDWLGNGVRSSAVRWLH